MKVVVFLMPLLMLPGATEIHGHQADDPLPVLLEKAIRDQDLDEAVQLFHRLEGEDDKSFDPDAELLSWLGNLLLEKARYEESRKVFDFNHARHPSASVAQRDLARLHYQLNQLDEARRWMKAYLEKESPVILSDVILKKRLMFVPEDFEPPGGLHHERFLLEPLGARHAEMDYAAVMGSVEHLTGAIGRRDWPGDLTLEEDREALRGHEWEFKQKVGFVYTVLAPEKTEVIGCVYIYPSRLDDYGSEVVLWVTAPEFEKGTDELLFSAVKSWLKTEWPFVRVIFPGRELTWGAFFDTLDKQDRKYIH